MSGHFDVRKDSGLNRRARAAYIATLMDEIMPPLRLVARGCGYAIAVHGSLARDIDLVAIPWVENAQDPDVLVQRLCGVIAGLLGRATAEKKWTEKPHGRRAMIIITACEAEIDLSVMPMAVAAPPPPPPPPPAPAPI